MDELVHGMGAGIQQGTVHSGESEESHSKVLGQQLVEPDHTEVLHHAYTVLAQVSEKDRSVAGTDVRHVVVQDIAFSDGEGDGAERSGSHDGAQR